MHDANSSLDSGTIRLHIAKRHGQKGIPPRLGPAIPRVRQNFKRLKNQNYVTGPIKTRPAIEPILTRSKFPQGVAFLVFTVFGPPSCIRLTQRAWLLAIAYPAHYE